MKLSMQGPDGQVQELMGHHKGMSTGEMGDCICVVVLWDFLTTGPSGFLEASRVRGFHFGGGLAFSDWSAVLGDLFHNVPNRPTTLVRAIFGPNALASNDRARLKKELHFRIPLAKAEFYWAGDARVSRAGVVTLVDRYKSPHVQSRIDGKPCPRAELVGRTPWVTANPAAWDEANAIPQAQHPPRY